MNITSIIVLIVFFYICFFLYGKIKKHRMIKKASAPRKNRRGSASQTDQRRYMAESVPALLEDYKLFQPSFFSRFSANYLSTGRYTNLTQDDLLEGAEMSEAWWTYNHCCYLASMRFTSVDKIEKIEDVEARGLRVSVFRSNPSCPNVPQDKLYKAGEPIPVYPCADCKEEKPCIFAYDYSW